MFKEMKAIFEVVETNNEYFAKGDRFVVKRLKSPCFAYGDQSQHIIDCDNEYNTHVGFDTRYSGISTQATAWRNYWKKYIEDNYGLKVRYIALG